MTQYNGWSNYPTYVAKVFLDDLQDVLCESVQQIYNSAVATEDLTKEQQAKFMTAVELEELVKLYIEGECTASLLVCDLLSYSISVVNWYELAEHYMELFGLLLEKDE